MKRYMLLVFLTLLFMEISWTCKGQDFASTYINLLKKELRALPYRDLTASYGLRYDSLEMAYTFQAPRLSIDSSLHARIDGKLNALPRTTTVSYKGTIRFDNYTDAIFIHSEVVGAALLINAMHVMAKPRGGMKCFMKRWGGFLDSLKAIGEFDDRNVGFDSFVYMFVDRDGSLSCRDTSEAGYLLQEFIQGEKPWGPGIMSGRPLAYRVALQVPSHGTDYNKLKDRQYSGIHRLVKINGQDEIVYFDYQLPREDEARTILSVAHEDHRYVSPVFHKGSVDELRQLVGFIKEEPVTISYFNPYVANRVYFYTMDN